MLNIIKGCTVPFPERLSEAYEVGERTIRANLSVEKIGSAVERFITWHKRETLFLFLELPTNLADEPEPERHLHKDIYYLDNLTVPEARELMAKYGELLIQDGMSSFGFGWQERGDEIMLERYNLVTTWSRRPRKYQPLFEELGLGEVEKLTTAQDTFDNEHPGSTSLYRQGELDVYALPELLKEQGMYFAERRVIS